MKDIFFGSEDNKLTLLPPFDHKEPKDDDCGLPQHPIFSNYSKYLWKGHTRSGGVQVGNKGDQLSVLKNTKIASDTARIM